MKSLTAEETAKAWAHHLEIVEELYIRLKRFQFLVSFWLLCSSLYFVFCVFWWISSTTPPINPLTVFFPALGTYLLAEGLVKRCKYAISRIELRLEDYEMQIRENAKAGSCAGCIYYNDNKYLNCAVHPTSKVNCIDYSTR